MKLDRYISDWFIYVYSATQDMKTKNNYDIECMKNHIKSRNTIGNGIKKHKIKKIKLKYDIGDVKLNSYLNEFIRMFVRPDKYKMKYMNGMKFDDNTIQFQIHIIYKTYTHEQGDKKVLTSDDRDVEVVNKIKNVLRGNGFIEFESDSHLNICSSRNTFYKVEKTLRIHVGEITSEDIWVIHL